VADRRDDRSFGERLDQVAGGGAIPVDLLVPGARAGQPQWVEYAVAHEVVPALAVDHLHDAREDGVAQRRAVAVGAAQRMDLWSAGEVADHALVNVVALARIAVGLLDAVGVVEQLARRDVGGDVWVGDPEAGEVASHRLVEAHPALVDELHERQRGPGLGHRAALVDRVRCGRLARQDVLDADGEVGDLAVVQDADGGARDLVLRQQLGHPLLDTCRVHRAGYFGSPTALAASASW
jgi:hypothetical protein